MNTIKLYHSDSYQREFAANAVSRNTIKQLPALQLDQTLFYPTSGGQMHDIGMINQVSVNEVIVHQGEIWHLLERSVEGERVHGQINWPRRFDFMQQHTAFHLLAQSFLRILLADTISSHLGEHLSTIDVNISEISSLDLESVERLANRVIWENRPVRAFFKRERQVPEQLLRAPVDTDQEVRLVEISDFDLDPCGGTHVRNTAEVGLVKIIAQEKIRGILRFTFVAGDRAYNEFQRSQAIIKRLKDELTTGSDKLLETVVKIVHDYKNEKRRASKFEEMAVEAKTRELTDGVKQDDVVVRLFENVDPGFTRKVASAAIKSGKGTYLLGSRNSSVALVFATTDKDLDLRPVLQAVTPEINGQGGGSPAFVQGGGDRSGGLARALEIAENQVVHQISSLKKGK